MPRQFHYGLVLFVLMAWITPVFAQREFGFDNRKPSGQPYLTPEETVKRFKVAPEFEVKLFAGEPQLVNPIAFTIDEKGRVWVVECFEYPSRTPKGKAPRDRIVILEDTDGDGTCDKRTVFAEGKDFPVLDERKKQDLGAFDMASGIEVGHGGVYVGAPPYLWFIENQNDKPGKFQVLLSGFGSQDTHETLNTFQWGPDGWLYGLHGVFTQSNVKPLDGPETRMNAAVWRFHPQNKKFEIFAEGTSNPWGLDWRNTDGQFILACCVIPHLYHMVPGGVYLRQAGVSYNPYVYDVIKQICDHTFHKESGWAHAGLISLDVPHMPAKYRNSVIFGSIHGCMIKQNILEPKGSSFNASRGDNFLESGDKNFRPINLKWGPNGDIYLIDWHDQNPCHQAKPDSWDYERGRVYRIQLKGHQPKKAEDLSKKTRQQLAESAVFAKDPWERRTAHRLLSENKSNFNVRISSPDDFLNFAMAMFAPAGALEKKDLPFWLDTMLPGAKGVPEGRAYVHRVISHIKDSAPELIARLTKEAESEPASSVRRELASAAIRLADNNDVTPLLRALMNRKEDANDPLIPHLVWIAYEKALSKKQGAATPAEKELAWLADQAPNNIFVRDQIVPKVMRRLVATGKAEDLALCVKFISDAQDINTREKALDGLAIALDKQTVDAPANWATLETQLRNEPRLIALANKLAVNFRDPKAFQRAHDVLFNESKSVSEKVEAVRAIAQLKHANSVSTLILMTTKDQAEAIRVEAMRGLTVYNQPKVADDILSFWAIYPQTVRSEAVNVLASRKEWAKLLLNALQGKQIDRRLVTDSAITRIQSFNDQELNALIEKSWGRTRPTPDELNKLIDKMRGELAAAPASFARGKIVFENQCAKCHKFGSEGAEVGPPLDGAARDIEYILANVIDPNRVIGSPYFQRIVKTLDGRAEQGLLAGEDDRSITLKVEKGELKRFLKADLDGPVKVIEKSMMPEGLTAGMSTQDFRDLVCYVMANPFLTAVTVNTNAVPVSVLGMIPLPKSDGSKPVVVEAQVNTPTALKTQLLVGTTEPYEVFVAGTSVGKGQGVGKRPEPDRAGFPIELPAGTSTVRIVVKHKGAATGLYARILDPDRKLTYPDVGVKK